jgi:hypothetical protein
MSIYLERELQPSFYNITIEGIEVIEVIIEDN